MKPMDETKRIILQTTVSHALAEAGVLPETNREFGAESTKQRGIGISYQPSRNSTKSPRTVILGSENRMK